MARVYLETSFVSYLTAAPRESRDPIAAAHQQLTIEWWSRRRADFAPDITQKLARASAPQKSFCGSAMLMEHVARVEAWIDREQLRHALDHQFSSGQDDDGERRFTPTSVVLTIVNRDVPPRSPRQT